MEGLKTFFLRAKHWQMFSLLFGTYVIAELAIQVFAPKGLHRKSCEGWALLGSRFVPIHYVFYGLAVVGRDILILD